MYIHEAVSEAMAQGRRMQRRSSTFWRAVRIRPTNTSACCLMETTEEFRKAKCFQKKVLSPRWNPSAEDLLADDWEVVD